MKKLLLFILLLWTSWGVAQSISQESSSKKNAVYVSGGTILLYANYTISFNRILLESGNSVFSLRALGGQYTYFTFFDGARGYLLGGAFNYSFKKLEVGAGLTFYHEDDEYSYHQSEGIRPVFNLGYKSINSSGFVFRAGLGFPEAVYIGIGWAF